MKNIEILDKKLCTGCFACVQKCPKKCIKLTKSKDGYFYPSVDNSLCVDCGLCAQVCPQLTGKSNQLDGMISYAVQCEDSIRTKCSSGGVFGAIAKEFISFGGLVCGAAFSDDFTFVHHIIVDNEEDLEKLFTSKYVQSSTEHIYRDIEELLKEGRKILFSGCPCQVDGLLHYLGKQYDNLYTIDILCHGVSSPEVYKSHLIKNNVNNDRITNVLFRDTNGFGKQFRIDFENQESYIEPYNGAYITAFSSGFNLRESCYNCKYSNIKRISDLTIGDYWGADKELVDGKGLSLALVHSIKGGEMLSLIKNHCSKLIKQSLSHALEVSKKINWALFCPTPKPDGRDIFFSHYKNVGISKAISYAKKEKMDIGILGWWMHTNSTNYGSNLTAFALERFLSSRGLSTGFVTPPSFNKNNAGPFNLKYKYKMTGNFSYPEMWRNDMFFDSYIVGSDVLWYYKAMIISKYTFMLDFAGQKKRKISYSTSFGNPSSFFPNDAIPYAKKLLSAFDFISTRELKGVDLLDKHFNIRGEQVLDPVFICPSKDWDLLAANAKRKTEDKFVFAYLLDPDEEKVNLLKKLGEHFNCKIISITDRQLKVNPNADLLADCGLDRDLDMEEFIYHMKNAEFVLTDSFHGTCFSLIFRKEFFALPNKKRDTTRFETLSSLFNIDDLMITDISKFLKNVTIKPIDYSLLSNKIEFHTKRSIEWLDKALFSNVKNKNLFVDKNYYK